MNAATAEQPYKEGWLKALGVKCPACGSAPHVPCRRILAPHERIPAYNPHDSRILNARRTIFF